MLSVCEIATKFSDKLKKTYERVVNKVSEGLVNNACDFKLLEQAYKEYIESL